MGCYVGQSDEIDEIWLDGSVSSVVGVLFGSVIVDVCLFFLGFRGIFGVEIGV